MEVTALCFKQVTVMILLWTHNQKADAASLHISPNKLQFFVYEQLTLNCEVGSDSRDKRIFKGDSPSCGENEETTPTGSSCTIKYAYPKDSGEYWCEAGGGKRSNIISITVTGDPVILESPALPVMEGKSVTLTCRNKMASSNFTADFYKDGVHISSSSTGNVTIHNASKSDDGLYSCKISGVGESVASRLTVGERCLQIQPSEHGCHPYIILRTTVTMVMVSLLLLLVGLLHYGKLGPTGLNSRPLRSKLSQLRDRS